MKSLSEKRVTQNLLRHPRGPFGVPPNVFLRKTKIHPNPLRPLQGDLAPSGRGPFGTSDPSSVFNLQSKVPALRKLA